MLFMNQSEKTAAQLIIKPPSKVATNMEAANVQKKKPNKDPLICPSSCSDKQQ